MYQLIVSYAENNRTALDEALFYLQMEDAVACAERHNPRVRVFFTGPAEGQYVEVTPKDLTQ